jgi:hypothetical protein
MKDAKKDIIKTLETMGVKLGELCVFRREYTPTKIKYTIGILQSTGTKIRMTEQMDVNRPYIYKNWRKIDGLVVNYDNIKFIYKPSEQERILWKLWKYT